MVLKKSASGPYPSLVVRLKGAAPLTLEGKVDIVQNRLRNTFPGAPDIPLSKFKRPSTAARAGCCRRSTTCAARTARTRPTSG